MTLANFRTSVAVARVEPSSFLASHLSYRLVTFSFKHTAQRARWELTAAVRKVSKSSVLTEGSLAMPWFPPFDDEVDGEGQGVVGVGAGPLG